MSDDLRNYLDGDLDRTRLSAEMQEEARAWDRLFQTLKRDVPGPAPAWIEGRIMSEIQAAAGTRGPRWWRWLVRPLNVRLSPLAIAAPAMALFVVAMLPWMRGEPAQDLATELNDSVVYVQFVLNAPGVGSVAVAGDFNGWDAGQRLADADGDGVWTGRVAVSPGVHEYMFIVDGAEWVTDPQAERYIDDGFGNRNAVLTIAAPGST